MLFGSLGRRRGRAARLLFGRNRLSSDAAVREMEVDQENGHAGQEQDIRHIEHPGKDLSSATWPVQSKREFPAREHVEEIPDSSDEEPVPEIAQCTREYQCDSNMRQSASSISLPSEDVQRDTYGNQREADEEDALIAADSEDGTGIQDKMKIKQAAGDRHNPFMWRDRVVT